MFPTLLSRYAPQSLAEYGQTGELVRSLLPMHLLLVGGPGVGKTTMCSTIVKEYFKGETAYNVQSNVFFINSLKDQGTAFYKTEVKCFCQTKCTVAAKKKIIVFDDLDSVLETGQQIFLSYIDNFGQNIFFIGTCRSSTKILDNIHSRMVAVRMEALKDPFLVALAEKVAQLESVAYDPEAVSSLVRRCNGSVRTLLSMMERFSVTGERITQDAVRRYGNSCEVRGLVEALNRGDFSRAVAEIDALCREGHSPGDVMDAFFSEIKAGDNGLTEEQRYRAVKVVCKYVSIMHTIQEHNVELVFFVSDLLAQWK
jgi:DNA polymerase III delta prime subunit